MWVGLCEVSAGLPTQRQATTGISEVTSLLWVERLWGLVGPFSSGKIVSKAFYLPKSVTAQPNIKTGENWTCPLVTKKRKEPFCCISWVLGTGWKSMLTRSLLTLVLLHFLICSSRLVLPTIVSYHRSLFSMYTSIPVTLFWLPGTRHASGHRYICR